MDKAYEKYKCLYIDNIDRYAFDEDELQSRKEEIQSLVDKVVFSSGKSDGRCVAIVSPQLDKETIDVLNSIDNIRVTTDTSGLIAQNENVYLIPDNKKDEIKFRFE